MLKQITAGTRILIGADGTELARQENVDVLAGNPSSSDTDEAKFSMGDTY